MLEKDSYVECAKAYIPLVVVVILVAAVGSTASCKPKAPLPLPQIVIPSPYGDAAIGKQYGPDDEANEVSLSLERLSISTHRSTPFLSSPNPHGVIGDDSFTVGWTGEHHVTIGWPQGSTPVSGPSRVGDVDVDYLAYVADITNKPITALELQLHNVSMSFSKVDPQDEVRPAERRSPGRASRCVIAVTGTDGKVFDRVTIQAIGYGARLPFHGFAGVRISVKPLADRRSPALTLTQAEVAGTFPRNDLNTAPVQGAWSILYGKVTRAEGERILAAIGQGSFDIKLALTFGQQVLAYHLDLPTTEAVVRSFHAC